MSANQPAQFADPVIRHDRVLQSSPSTLSLLGHQGQLDVNSPPYREPDP